MTVAYAGERESACVRVCNSMCTRQNERDGGKGEEEEEEEREGEEKGAEEME